MQATPGRVTHIHKKILAGHFRISTFPNPARSQQANNHPGFDFSLGSSNKKATGVAASGFSFKPP
jgi:hypothetical protein